jgi:hypothetical protein
MDMFQRPRDVLNRNGPPAVATSRTFGLNVHRPDAWPPLADNHPLYQIQGWRSGPTSAYASSGLVDWPSNNSNRGIAFTNTTNRPRAMPHIRPRPVMPVPPTSRTSPARNRPHRRRMVRRYSTAGGIGIPADDGEYSYVPTQRLFTTVVRPMVRLALSSAASRQRCRRSSAATHRSPALAAKALLTARSCVAPRCPGTPRNRSSVDCPRAKHCPQSRIHRLCRGKRRGDFRLQRYEYRPPEAAGILATNTRPQ